MVNHTLTIKNLNGKLILDFFNITSVTASTAVTGTTPIKHIPVGKITGGVLGGVFGAVVMIIVGAMLLKRKNILRLQTVDVFPLPRRQPMALLIYNT